MTKSYKISFVTNAEEAKKYPIISQKDEHRIAEAFKHLYCYYEQATHDKCDD